MIEDTNIWQIERNYVYKLRKLDPACGGHYENEVTIQVHSAYRSGVDTNEMAKYIADILNRHGILLNAQN